MEFIWILTLIGTFLAFYSISEGHKKRNFIYKCGINDILLLSTLFTGLLFAIICAMYLSAMSYEVSRIIYGISVPDYFIFSFLALILTIVITFDLYITLNGIKIKRKKEFLFNLEAMLNSKEYGHLITDMTHYFEKNFEKYLKYTEMSYEEREKYEPEKYWTYLTHLKFLEAHTVQDMKQFWNLYYFLDRVEYNEEFIYELSLKNPNLFVNLLGYFNKKYEKEIYKTYAKVLFKNEHNLLYFQPYNFRAYFYSDHNLLKTLNTNLDGYLNFFLYQLSKELINYLDALNKNKLTLGVFENPDNCIVYASVSFFINGFLKALDQNYDISETLSWFNTIIEKIIEKIPPDNKSNFKNYAFSSYEKIIDSTYDFYLDAIDKLNDEHDFESISENYYSIIHSLNTTTISLLKNNCHGWFKVECMTKYLMTYHKIKNEYKSEFISHTTYLLNKEIAKELITWLHIAYPGTLERSETSDTDYDNLITELKKIENFRSFN
ncbi:hypothetical protein HNP86_001577 [Methanococcus maripaludis]|uniref:Uncharacterized protein n=1 Tax=Methanococcus maripaludis TaxID=39152 RepID=A0A7J9NVT5_METMI|nr:hypothetical protein [Methanococcus maripaludis]MBA2851424.1 hypothetical protein [Methanococcus maripaludis]